MRVAAVDCGTNSIRLLIADIDDGVVHDVIRTMRIVRLGQGVDVTGSIAQPAMERTMRAVGEYAALCREHDVERVRFVATSASRDADNSAEFTAGVATAFADWGVAPEVITGAEEARLSFVGAVSGVSSDTAGPYLVVDLGGGSTEFVLGRQEVQAAISTDIGCVRLTERHLRTDPPTPAELEAATADIEAALDQAAQAVPLERAGSLIGVAGSVTTITAHALGLPQYDADRIDGTQLPVERVLESCAALVHEVRSQRAEHGFMHPGRVDVIGAGALIWSRVVRRVQQVAGIEVVGTSEHDILDGIALSVN